MRVRSAVAVSLILALPNTASAQRVGGVRGGMPQPAPLGPQAPAVARAIAYQRSRVSVESYPFASYVSAPWLGSVGKTQHWTNLGMGSRMEYRTTGSLMATLDMTSSLVGGPSSIRTVEVGGRYRPLSDSRFRPYLDARVAYLSAGGMFGTGTDGSLALATPIVTNGIQYSTGWGGVAGAGMEYWVSRKFAVTSAATFVRSNMTAHEYSPTTFNDGTPYMMTSYRLTLGLKFNPVRTVVVP